MVKHQERRLTLGKMILISAPFMFGSVYAAKPIDLANQPFNKLQSFISTSNLGQSNGLGIVELKRSVDFNKTLHVRVQQTYLGYPVWGADAVVHVPHGNKQQAIAGLMQNSQGSMNGNFFADIHQDVSSVSNSVFTAKQSSDALNHVLNEYNQTFSKQMVISNQQAELIVFVDSSNKAHWAYKVTFYAKPVQQGVLPQKPVYIIDAETFQTYLHFDDVKTAGYAGEEAVGGGYGGNENMGKYYYDGLSTINHLPKLRITRDSGTEKCTYTNSDVTVRNYKDNGIVSYNCKELSKEHNDTYWVDKLDPVNGGYSPSADALFGGQVIKQMYKAWYDVPVLTNSDGTPMMLTMVVHEKMDNAYWDGQRMTFGDGIDYFYPLTSLGVASHEISHGFTEQHSNLSYYGQSGGMNEAFSDMAAQAAELFAYNTSSYQIGPEIMKEKGTALRYMDVPSKDCPKGKKPGDWCSIDKASQYSNGLDVHFSSGVYNRAYYTLATSEGWDQRKAFDVMVKANSDYWTSSSTFVQGACGVISAAKDLGYDTKAVLAAFAKVEVKTSTCKV